MTFAAISACSSFNYKLVYIFHLKSINFLHFLNLSTIFFNLFGNYYD